MYNEIYEQYYRDIDAEDVSASIGHIFRYIRRFNEQIEESEVPVWFEMSFMPTTKEIKLEKCSRSYSVEQGGFNDPINYNYHSTELLRFSATAEEYINMLTDYIMREQEFKEFYRDNYDRIRFNKIWIKKPEYIMIM